MTAFDPDLMNLIQKIKGFDHDGAKPADCVALAQALKLVADDVLKRHEDVSRMQDELARKLVVAESCVELAGVVAAFKPEARSWRRYLPW